VMEFENSALSRAIIGRKYQRPCVSIALIELEGLDDPDKALQALDEAAQRPEYDILRPSPLPDVVEYVRACTYCFKAAQKDAGETTGLLRQAIESLTRACANNNEYVRTEFTKERRQYFDVLEAHPEFNSAFLSAIQNLSEPTQALDPAIGI
jgi:hypothetical protein